MHLPRSRRNVALLAACQALAMTGNTIVITITAIVGAMLADDKALATLPLALQFVATMTTTFPASHLMRRIGRRAGFMVGAAIGLVACSVAMAAIFAGDFRQFCLGAILYGAFQGFVLFYRHAAADTADAEFKSKAISLVVAGGVVAAIVGPLIAIWSRDLFAPFSFAGCYAAIFVLQLVAMTLLAFVDIPRLTAAQRRTSGRPLLIIMRQPRFIVAAAAGMIGYGAMSLIMTATPLAILACGLAFEDAAFVIQWHAIGMFAPSFVTGSLINRFGVLRIIVAGALLTAGCVAINLSGIGLLNFWPALVLLGIGWNFMFVGGTTLLTGVHTAEERAKTQAANDFLVFGSVSLAALGSGVAFHSFGWATVNVAVLPMLVAVVAAAVWLRARRVPAEA